MNRSASVSHSAVVGPPQAVAGISDTTSPALPRRVVHILNSAAGGAAISTIDLIGEFAEHGIVSSAICHTAGESDECRRLSDAVEGRVLFTPLRWWNRKIRAAAWKRPLIELKQFFATGCYRGSERIVTRFIERQQAELIHTNTLTTPVGGVAARRLRLPHVWHVRELVGPNMPYRFSPEGPELGRHLASSASLVVANSHTTARCLRPWLPDGLLRVVPNGVDVRRFSASRRETRPNPTVVAMVGNLTSSKKQSLFLQAAAMVNRALPVEFRLYGHMPSSGATRRHVDDLMERLQLGSRLAFPGFVVDPRQIMAEIDVLVHTSDHESFGRIVVEAMAAALPVVAMRGGASTEIVIDGKTGLLATPNSPREIAAHIERLVGDDGLRRALGEAGRIRAEAEYDLRTCAASLMELYRLAPSSPFGPAAAQTT